MFNAFKYTKQLEEAGFSRQQAEMQLQVMTEIVEGDLATKQDLQSLDTNLRKDLQNMESALRKDLHYVESELRKDLKLLETNLGNAIESKVSTIDFEKRVNGIENSIQQLEHRLTIKLGTLLIVGFTTIATLMKLWIIR